MGDLEIKKSGVTSQLGEQNIIDNIVDLKANFPLLLSLPSSTKSGSIKRIVVVVAEPTIDIDSVINCDKKQRDVVVIMVTATVTAERFVKPDFNKKNRRNKVQQ